MIIKSLVLLCSALLATSCYAGNPEQGRDNYDIYCSMCHGTNGEKVMPDAADFSRGEGLVNSDLNLVRRIEDGKSTCPGFGGILTRQEILDVIAYTRTLNR